MSKFISFLIIISLLSSPLSLTAGAAPKDNRQRIATPQNSPGYKPGEVLVKFKPAASSKQRQLINKRSGAIKTLRNLGLEEKQKISLVKLDEGVSVKKAVKEFESEGLVEYAEPNYLRKTTALTPYDPFFPNQWGLDNIGQEIAGIGDADMDVKEAWLIEKGTSNPVTVAVIDSGIDLDHEDLKNKIVEGYNWAGISQYNTSWGAWPLGSSDQDSGFAQSIKGTGQQITDLGIFLGSQGTPTKNISVSIREGSINGNEIAAYTIANEKVGNAKEIYKELSPQPVLTKGATYFIRIWTENNSGGFYEIYDNAWGNDPEEPLPDYVDDPYTEGQEYFWNGSSWVAYPTDDLYFRTNPDAYPHDNFGHGTHVSGIIAAEINNNKGVAGISAGAKIMPLKVADSSGTLDSDAIIEAIYYAANTRADIINMSFAGTEYSAIEQAAVNYAYEKGVVMFASAGNEGDPLDGGNPIEYPAAYANVVSVGATDNTDSITYYSNHNAYVDISAPGDEIYSTMPSYQVGLNNYWYDMNYSYMSGTSMASPMAAGVAALLLSQDPTLTPLQVEQRLESSANDKGALNRDDYFGYGRVNALNALEVAGDLPPEPWDPWPQPPTEPPPKQQQPSQQIQPATNTGSNTQVTNPPKTILSTILSLIKPKAVKKGKLVTVKGRLKDAGGKPLAGEKVVIKKRVLKKIRKKVKGKIKTIKKWVWKKIATVKTDAKGNFSKKIKAKETTILKSEYTGDGDYYSSSSKAVKVTVKR